MIQHYPSDWGTHQWRKERTSVLRRADDRRIAAGVAAPLIHDQKKDTRHWCRGKVGVEHQPRWVFWLRTAFGQPGAYYKRICQACGKHLDMEFRAEAGAKQQQ